MIEISQADAVNRFSQLMQPYSVEEVNPREIIDALTAFYRDFRIAAATLEEDEDMLLLEWGAASPILLSYFTDFRPLTDADLKFASRKFQWIGLTRQIFSSVDEEAEFDDCAIGLTADIFFTKATGDERSSNLWIPRPSELDHKLNEFLQNEFVESLLNTNPTLVRASIGYVG